MTDITYLLTTPVSCFITFAADAYTAAPDRGLCALLPYYIFMRRAYYSPTGACKIAAVKMKLATWEGGEEVAVCLLKFLSWVFPCLTPVCYSAESFAQERRGIFLRHMKISEMSRSMLLPSLHILDSNSWIIPNRVIRFQGYSLSKREAKIVLRLCARGIHWETESRSRHTRK